MFEDLKFRKIVNLCTKGSCCPTLKLTMDGAWIVINDDFGGSSRIPADEELLIQTIKKLFNKEEVE